ncbi:uncharacterized protein LOC131609152 [Vicia villosa]|uniref:uncharacterized protein LOC131609152 n=1 Tax=Vicia villosa TaxID=3911 RepID=UPI00273B2C76|nr:uncharacterized protein LOC131609152 [Vicia villosa]
MKTFMEKEDVRYAEYKMLRTTNALRLDRVEEQLVALKVSSASNGDLDSFLQSPENQSLVILTRMTDQPQEEIDDSDLLDVEVLTTPYTTAETSTLSEALSETLLVVDASNLSSDRVIEPSISNFYVVSTIKDFIPSIVGHDCYSKKKTTTEVDSKRPGSLTVIVRRNLSPVVTLTLPMIPLLDPYDLVFILPPPLAPPWLHHSLYTRPLKSLTSIKVNNLIHYLQFKQNILIGTQYHNTPIIDPQIPSVCVLTCYSYAYKNTVSLIDAHYLFVKIPLTVDFSFDTFTSLLSMMKIIGQIDMDSQYSASNNLLHNYHVCSNGFPSSGLGLEFGLISIVGSVPLSYYLLASFACNSCGMILNRNLSCHDFVSLFYCCHIELLLVLYSSHCQTKLKGGNWLSIMIVERTAQVKLQELLSFHHFAMLNVVVVYDLTLNGVLGCKVMPLQSFDDSSGNHNSHSRYKNLDFSISVECKELIYAYFTGSELELSGVFLGLDKLVNNGNFNLSSISMVGSFGYPVSQCAFPTINYDVWFQSTKFKWLTYKYLSKIVIAAYFMIIYRLWICHELYILVQFKVMHIHFLVVKITFQDMCVVSKKEKWWRKVTVLGLRAKLLVVDITTIQMVMFVSNDELFSKDHPCSLAANKNDNCLAHAHATHDDLSFSPIFFEKLYERLINGLNYKATCFGKLGYTLDAGCVAVIQTLYPKVINNGRLDTFVTWAIIVWTKQGPIAPKFYILFNATIVKWDPGGYFIFIMKIHLTWKSLERMLLLLICIVMISTLRTRLIFNGGGNVMIQIEEKPCHQSESLKWLEKRDMCHLIHQLRE